MSYPANPTVGMPRQEYHRGLYSVLEVSLGYRARLSQKKINDSRSGSEDRAVSLDDAMPSGLKSCKRGLTLTHEIIVLLGEKSTTGKKNYLMQI